MYEEFTPIHLDRIRSALSKLAERPPESVYQVSHNVNDAAEAPESRLTSHSGTVLLLQKKLEALQKEKDMHYNALKQEMQLLRENDYNALKQEMLMLREQKQME